MIAAAELDAILQWVDEKGLSEQVIAELREKFPGKHFTYCMDDDINGGKPYAERDAYAVYLVDSSDHCSCLTSDPESASGIVLAEIDAD